MDWTIGKLLFPQAEVAKYEIILNQPKGFKSEYADNWQMMDNGPCLSYQLHKSLCLWGAGKTELGWEKDT